MIRERQRSQLLTFCKRKIEAAPLTWPSLAHNIKTSWLVYMTCNGNCCRRNVCSIFSHMPLCQGQLDAQPAGWRQRIVQLQTRCTKPKAQASILCQIHAWEKPSNKVLHLAHDNAWHLHGDWRWHPHTMHIRYMQSYLSL